jgi:Uma2 family endonuclease
MDAAALVSAEEYLDTPYSPDREYVDGVVVERQVGERPHSRVQVNLVRFLEQRYPHLFAWAEQRIRTVPGKRWRIPDVCITSEDPEVDVFENPPLLCIEILSRKDRMTDLLEKLEEYRAFGVPEIWVIDPRRKKVFTYSDALYEVRSDVVTAAEISLPLSEIFHRL